jgi:hypothetical protein
VTPPTQFALQHWLLGRTDLDGEAIGGGEEKNLREKICREAGMGEVGEGGGWSLVFPFCVTFRISFP